MPFDKRTTAQLNRATRGLFGIVMHAFREFFSERAMEAGSSIAFYAFFSIFPLSMFLIAFLGIFLDQAEVQRELVVIMERVFPLTHEEFSEVVQSNLDVVFERRGSISVLAGLGLLWAGSNVFAVVAGGISRAWHTTAKPLGFFQGRLAALIILTVLATFIVLSFVATGFLELLSRVDLPFLPDTPVQETVLWANLARMGPYVLSVLFSAALFKWIPNTRVLWREAFIAGTVVMLGWRLAVEALTWSLRAGVLNYQVVYGSLATIVISMFWMYVSSLVLLFGAHLSASIARATRRYR